MKSEERKDAGCRETKRRRIKTEVKERERVG
jgi:hypothetical protein